MKDKLNKYLRNQRRYEIFWLLMKLFFAFITLFFIAFSLGQSIGFVESFLIVFGFTFLLILFVTLPRWRNYYKDRFGYAFQFAEELDMNTNELKKALEALKIKSLPKELFWINFEIVPPTFKINVQTHTTNKNEPSISTKEFQDTIRSIVPNAAPTTKIERRGWGEEDKIELSLELIKRWLTYNWNLIMPLEFKSRVTVSIKDRNGHFNMRNNKWEGTNYLSGYYLERMFRI